MIQKPFAALCRAWARTLFVGAMAIALAVGIARAQGANEGFFIQAASSHSFAQTTDALKRAASTNGMMVMGHLDQKKALSMTGLNLAGAETFFVGNPVVGKKLFEMSAAAGAVLPVRIYVWETGGQAHVGYFQPSSLLAAAEPNLGMPGKMLDLKFSKILQDTIH